MRLFSRPRSRPLGRWMATSFALVALACAQQRPKEKHVPIHLPTSKTLSAPAPGRIGDTNSFPATIVISPDGRYAALLNDGYGNQETLAHQSIAVLDLKINRMFDYPDARLSDEAHQSYFIGLSFSSDGKHLYASVGSITDPSGEKPGDTGNGIAVYKFSDGKVTPERFIPIAPQPMAAGKAIGRELRKTPDHTAIPYPAGIALIAGSGSTPDRLLVANNLSDSVVLLDSASGKILQSFDLSAGDLVPSAFPYTVVATRDGRRAWCSLWNASSVAELDLSNGKVVRSIKLLEPDDPLAPGSHPTAMLLSPNEHILYVALANADRVAAVSTAGGEPLTFFSTNAPTQKYPGSYPSALAQSADGGHLFVADASLDAVAVFDTSQIGSFGGTAQEADRWIAILQALLCGWVVYVAATGMLVEGILLPRQIFLADFLIALLAAIFYLFSLISTAAVLFRGHPLSWPRLFHWVVMLLAVWCGLRWWQMARSKWPDPAPHV